LAELQVKQLVATEPLQVKQVFEQTVQVPELKKYPGEQTTQTVELVHEMHAVPHAVQVPELLK
jgi:hypothetical protein